MSTSYTIAIYQPMLQAIAYRMVGCIQDAEDIVQETFYKWLTIDHGKIENTKAYLIKAVRNNCLNHINSIKQKKKEYLDAINIQDFIDKMDFSYLDLKQELASALEVINKKLAPLERSVFLLREAFDFEYDELQVIFNKKKEHCRQLVCRAKEKLSQETTRFSSNFEIKTGFLEAFKKASAEGQFQELLGLLKVDEK